VVNADRVAQLLRESLMLVTALTPHIGYDKSSSIAKHAHHKRLTLKQAAMELGHIDEATFDKAMKPETMVGPS